MKSDHPDSEVNRRATRRSLWPWLLAGGCVLVLLLALNRPNLDKSPPAATPDSEPQAHRTISSSKTMSRLPANSSPGTAASPVQSAEEIVSAKLVQFTRDRRALARKFAEFVEVQVPTEVEGFFALAEAGDWNQLTNAFESLKKLRDTDPHESFRMLWPVLSETFGVAEAARAWPAQQLLDYGNAMLGSLRPGTIYTSGSDAGRYIPTLLNDTDDGERHVVLAHNAFADSSYMEYVRFLHGEKLQMLGKEDSQRAFTEYVADAQKRLQQDSQFPNEPKQIRPGEDIRITENRVQVSGQVAVMAINGRLLQMLVDKNPDASFAVEQPFSEFSNSNPSRSGEILELKTPEEFRDWIKQWEASKKK